MIVKKNHQKTNNKSIFEIERVINIESNKLINAQKVCKNQTECDVQCSILSDANIERFQNF